MLDLFLEFAQGLFELERVRGFVHETVKATNSKRSLSTGRAGGVVGGILELVFPTEDLGAGAILFGGGLVAFFHKNARERGMDEEVIRPQREGTRGGGGGVVEASQGKIDLGEGMPSFEGIGPERRGTVEFGQGGIGVAERVIERGVFDQRLEVGLGHRAEVSRRFTLGKTRILTTNGQMVTDIP